MTKKHNWGPWEQDCQTLWWAGRKCLDCGEYQSVRFRTLCDIR